MNEKTALEYDFISVKEYSYCFINPKTNEKTIATIKASVNYPIFAYKFCDDWAKIYQPLAPKSYVDKDGKKRNGLKHSFVGKKPERHVFGLTRLRVKYQEAIEIFNLDIEKAKKDKNEKLIAELTVKRDEFKLASVIICSGGSDGTIKKIIVDSRGKRQSVEHFYIKDHSEEIKQLQEVIAVTENKIKPELFDANGQASNNDKQPSDDLPY